MSAEELFDRSREYEEMLNRGIRLSGEDREYFLRGRVAHLVACLGSDCRPRRILDFGCGIGDTASHLSQVFPDAEVLGVDSSERALEYARSRHGSTRVRFAPTRQLEREPELRFDLCYTNGVFHHIAPARRLAAVRSLHRILVPGGSLAFMENNPWNPGTRLVMARIPFDREAIPLSPLEARRLLRAGGFRRCEPLRTLFYFPRALSFLRPLEPLLARLPLGAQYHWLARKEGDPIEPAVDP